MIPLSLALTYKIAGNQEEMSYDDPIVISSDSDSESAEKKKRSGSLTPEYIYTESGHVISHVDDEQFYCYNYLLDKLQATYKEIINFHNYNAESYQFKDFCESIKKYGLDFWFNPGEEQELNHLTNEQRIIFIQLLQPMLDTIAYETSSCDSYGTEKKLFLFCYKVVDIMSGA